MQENFPLLWAGSNGETIEFIYGYYKLISDNQMIPLGKTIDEVILKLVEMNREEIVNNLQCATTHVLF